MRGTGLERFSEQFTVWTENTIGTGPLKEFESSSSANSMRSDASKQIFNIHCSPQKDRFVLGVNAPL